MNRTLLLFISLGVLSVAAFLILEPSTRSTSAPSPSEGIAPVAKPVGAVPIPESALGPAIPEKGYLVEEIGDGLYWVTDGLYQVMFLTTGEGVVVIDAPPSLVESVRKAIGEVTAEPITHVIYSHSHADHIGAAGLYPPDATYIAQEETASRLARATDPNRPYGFGAFLGGAPVPLPTATFTDRYTLNVGSQTLELAYRGNNHASGNLFIYAPRQKVLMLVDVIFPGWVPFKNLALAEDVPGYVRAHDEALSFDFDTFIGGHLTRLGTREDVRILREYIWDVRDNAARALQTVDFFAIAEQTGFENPWLLFDRYLDEVAQECADLTLKTWRDRLGGADVFTFDHCFVLAESLRID
jgi:glyoxylase-like metal-dependent hydrolase (beta-lactamase superfamily II)